MSSATYPQLMRHPSDVDDCKDRTGLVLYVKAGADGQRYGACPFCQRVFMVLLVKSLYGRAKLNFRVVTVNLARPPEEFPSVVCDDFQRWSMTTKSMIATDRRRRRWYWILAKTLSVTSTPSILTVDCWLTTIQPPIWPSKTFFRASAFTLNKYQKIRPSSSRNYVD